MMLDGRNDIHLSTALSPRYQRLATDVLSRLPSGWNSGRVIRLEESNETLYMMHGRSVAACSARLQFKSDELWIVTLYTSVLHELSDEAVQWVLAREFGRVACHITQSWRSRWSGQPVLEMTADALALTWGFSEEYRQFEREYVLPKAS